MRIAAQSTKKATEYQQYIRRKWGVLIGLLLLTFVMGVVCISGGSSGLSPSEVLKALVGKGSDQSRTILWNVRMPRIAAGASVGTALAMAGCIMQNVLRNPLASPSTLGVSQGASFGAAFAIVYLGAGIQLNASSATAIAVTNPFMVTLCAFLGGVATTGLILGLTRLTRVAPSTMVLAGVAISSMFTGATALVQYFADDVMVSSVVYWTFGSLGRASWREIGLIALLSVGAFLIFMGNRWNYNAMESGAYTAKSLGVSVDALVLASMVLCALISSVSVAFVGNINFIGLIAPHMARRFVGSDHRFLIPCSALMGAALMLGADLLSRMLVPPMNLPIGALTSFLGAPLFLYMIVKKGSIK